jgi:hypothetical protein
MGICENGKPELLYVAAIKLIAWPREVLGTAIGVQPILQSFTNG